MMMWLTSPARYSRTPVTTRSRRNLLGRPSVHTLAPKTSAASAVSKWPDAMGCRAPTVANRAVSGRRDDGERARHQGGAQVGGAEGRVMVRP